MRLSRPLSFVVAVFVASRALAFWHDIHFQELPRFLLEPFLYLLLALWLQSLWERYSHLGGL